MADFSVIIPAFNDGGCIRDAIESVLSQGFLRQVIVVDDGSSDDTADVVKAIKDNRVLLLRKENEGPALARNAGAREATASHLVFLDADDVLLTGALSAFAHQHDRGDLLVRGVAVVRRGRDVRSNPSVASKFPYPRGSPLAGSFSVERRLFDELGGYDGEFRYGENSELLLRVALRLEAIGCSDGFISNETVSCFEREGRKKDHYDVAKLKAAERMIDKHGHNLRKDFTTMSNHHAIVAHLLLMDGHASAARHHAVRSLRFRPRSLRGWGRLALCILPLRRSRAARG